MKKLIRQFNNPDAAYRGKPFWSWNGALEAHELERQIDVLHDMGMGGYFCHSRTGLATEYLGKEWFEYINLCASKGKKADMETWLYDEDRWPSGTAGGMVTKNHDYRIHYIRLNVVPASEFTYSSDMIAAFSVTLDGQSFTGKKRIYGPVAPQEGSQVLYFTTEEMQEYSFYNGETYVDTMNPEATEEFLRITHEQYAQKCSKGIKNGSIKGIFTDEPHHGGIMCGFALQNPEGNNLTPYPKDLFPLFEQRFGYDLTDYLPELYLFRDGERVSPVKWQYCELLCELYIKNYLMPIEDWCHKNGLIFTGHLLHEDCLAAQASVNGSMQRGYEHMDAPGVDVLWENNYNRNIVKQLQSSARQFGKKTLMSELYGCTGWQMTFQNHKAVGDWQSLYGINLRCHHLAWYTMKGEAKRDYPGSIFFQSEWYRQYKYVEDYFSRLNVIRQDGVPVCDTLVMSPVESLWATVHPGWCDFFSATDDYNQRVEKDYAELFHILERNHIDFDFGDEEQMARLCSISRDENGALLALGQAVYRTLIVPTCITIRSTTVELARNFAQSGGRVIFLCSPDYVDAVPSQAAKDLPVTYTQLNDGLASLLNSNPYIRISCGDIALQTLVRPEGIVFVMLNLDRENPHKQVRISLKKDGFVEKWDARSGEITLAACGKCPEIIKDFAPGEELVLFLRDKSDAKPEPELATSARVSYGNEFSYCLTEPNIAVLDNARYRLGQGEESGTMEILKLDREVRKRLGIPWRNGEMLQPWFKQKEGLNANGASAPLSISFDFSIEHMCELTLMLETPEVFDIKINGSPLTAKPLDRLYIDPCFKLIPIDGNLLRTGLNTVTLECTFSDSVDLEAIYLLGLFGVRTEGTLSVLTALPDKLSLGDVTKQGLPFYSGSIDYLLPPINAGDGRVFLSVPDFAGACITVHGNGKSKIIAFAPYTADITELAGEDTYVRLHLTRRNTFGPMHMNPVRSWNYGPDTFLTEGDAFMYDGFSLIENGIMAPIELEIKKPEKHK